ncbi:Phosphofructokinase [Musa troglodytarum]|uniref:Phosphofructokinase n=1 Tax=Musa troglodytarum TaxID=320322 RepID=A0A9E7K0D8_9LILI|nr:Phosphofructokinase [Musa troglodytarum]
MKRRRGDDVIRVYDPRPGVTKNFINEDGTVPQKRLLFVKVPKESIFDETGPRQRVYFEPEDVYACIVTCGGPCPGLATVIKEIVSGLSYMYGVKKIVGKQAYIMGGDGTQNGAAVIFERMTEERNKGIVNDRV